MMGIDRLGLRFFLCGFIGSDYHKRFLEVLGNYKEAGEINFNLLNFLVLMMIVVVGEATEQDGD